MVAEAPLEHSDHGVFPVGDGWFVVNARDAQWFESDGLGFFAPFEGENAPFGELGFNLNILRPGEPSCMYHGEETQEDFLVLAGECVLVVEGQERSLKAWDFVHCAPWTETCLRGFRRQRVPHRRGRGPVEGPRASATRSATSC